MKKSLVILSNNFGTNFSGGCLATCKIFEPIEHLFKEIIVISEKVGNHAFNQIHHLKYHRKKEALHHLHQLKNRDDLIFYGDFFMAAYFIEAKVPYYFTYHDNWPEQASTSFKARFQAFYFVPLYKKIFKHAQAVVHVSEKKLELFKSYNPNSYLVRNGIGLKDATADQTYDIDKSSNTTRILMLGNIDERKYGQLLPILKSLVRVDQTHSFEFFLYGHQQDKNLASRLDRFNFVYLMGFQQAINFNQFDVMLMTSKIENLPISVCEAIFHKLPVIAFNVGGLSEIITTKQNGILVKPFDTQEMLSILMQIADKKISFDFSHQDLTSYSWEQAASQYAKILGLQPTNKTVEKIVL